MKHTLRAALCLLPLFLAAQPETFKLTEVILQKRDFTGTIEYAKTAIISFESKGRLDFVAAEGQYVQCSVFDKNGSLVKKGDLLARQDTDLPTSDLKIAKAELARAKAVLKEKTLNLERDAKLSKREAVSARQFQETQMLYDTALIDTQKAELAVKRATQVLDACYIWTPFNAFIEEVYRSEGAAVDVGNPVMKISMIDPVKLQLKRTQELSELLPQTTQILVYPRDSAIPVPAWFVGQNLSAENLTCYGANPRVTEKYLTPDGQQLPTFDFLTAVLSIPEKSSLAPFWIPENVIRKDDKGYYVWRLTGIPDTTIGKLIPSITRLEKVRIETTDLYIQYGNMIRQGVKSATLKTGDILAADVSESIPDHALAVYSRKHHRFQIGETVRVVFFTGNSEHVFHVPPQVLHTEADGKGKYVLVKREKEPEKIPVSVLRRVNAYLQIFSEKLAAGQELILQDK